DATIEAAAGHWLAADQHLALRRLEESRDDVEERRLAAAASPHHAQKLGLRHRDGDVAQRGHRPLGRLVLEREMAQLDEAQAQPQTLTRAPSRARHPDHAPPAHGPALERLEDNALEDEPEDADGDERGDHDVGVEELLGVEDQPAEAPAGGGD